jgi:LacI family transcriptional regulator
MGAVNDSGNRPRAATIVNVAEAAGVAIGTVSRYLNGQSVRAANRDQIEEAIHRLNYRKNALAAAMKSDLTNTVGFLVPRLSEFHAGVLERLSLALRQQGRALLSYCHNDDTGSVMDALEFFNSHRVDGLVMDARPEAVERIRDTVRSGTPIIFYDNNVPGPPVDRILVDNRAASYRVVRQLLDVGHSRVAVLTGNIQNWTGRERFEGYREAMLEHGHSINPDYVLDTHWSEDEAYSGMLRLLTLPSPPTALYCCNYNMAMGALRMLKERGLRVPEDISMASFDDVPLFALYNGGITAVAQPIAKIADTIASILASRLSERGNAQPPHSIVLNCDIILRDSVKPPRDSTLPARVGRMTTI